MDFLFLGCKFSDICSNFFLKRKNGDELWKLRCIFSLVGGDGESIYSKIYEDRSGGFNEGVMNSIWIQWFLLSFILSSTFYLERRKTVFVYGAGREDKYQNWLGWWLCLGNLTSDFHLFHGSVGNPLPTLFFPNSSFMDSSFQVSAPKISNEISSHFQ